MATTRHALTNEYVKRLKPEEKPYRIWDTKPPQLFLRVQPSGVKSFNVQVARSTSVALGKHPALTVDAARTQALQQLGSVAKGELPPKLAAKRAKKQARLEGRPQTLDQLLAFYEAGPHKKLRHPEEAVKRVKQVYAELVPLPLDKITEERISARHRARLREVSEATAARDLTGLHGVFTWAVRRGHLPAHPLKELKPDSKASREIVRYLSPDERARLFKALKDRDTEMRAARERTLAGGRAQHADLEPIPADGFADYLEPLVRVALNTACRRGELLKLRWDAVDLAAGHFTIRRQGRGSNKTNAERHVILNRDALETLKKWHKQTGGEGRVFPIDSVKRAWGSLLKRAKIEGFRFHDLRHDAASQLVMAGVDLYPVSKILGHANPATTRRYAHLSPDHLREQLAELDAINSPTPPKPAKVVSIAGRRRAR